MSMFGSINSFGRQSAPMQVMPTQFVPPPPIQAMDGLTIDPKTNAPVAPGAAPQGQAQGGGLIDSVMKMFGGAPAGGATGAGAPAAGAAPGGLDITKLLAMFAGG